MLGYISGHISVSAWRFQERLFKKYWKHSVWERRLCNTVKENIRW